MQSSMIGVNNITYIVLEWFKYSIQSIRFERFDKINIYLRNWKNNWICTLEQYTLFGLICMYMLHIWLSKQGTNPQFL